MYSIRYLLVNELMPDDYYERGESSTPFKELSKERYKEFSPHLSVPWICKPHRLYHFYTGDDFGGFAIRNTQTNEIRSFMVAFPYVEIPFTVNENEKVYPLETDTYSLKGPDFVGKFSIIGSNEIKFSLLEIMAIATSMTVASIAKEKNGSIFLLISSLVLCFVPAKLYDVRIKLDKEYYQKRKAFFSGIKAEKIKERKEKFEKEEKEKEE